MRASYLVLVIAACGPAATPPIATAPTRTAQAPGAAAGSSPGPAWQAFAPSEFSSVFSGHQRAFWPTTLPEPSWLAATFVNLTIDGYDGEQLVGDVDMWAAIGLDPADCAVEVIWDAHHRGGARLAGPTQSEAIPTLGHHADWRFIVPVPGSPPILDLTAYVFCPVDDAHRAPPTGVMLTSVQTTAGGPHARDAMCGTLRHDHDLYRSPPTATLQTGLAIDLRFACGVLPRTRDRDLVDDCTGDVLVATGSLGLGATVSGEPVGAPPADVELRAFLDGAASCTRIVVDGAEPNTQHAFDAIVQRLGPRLLDAWVDYPRPQPDL